MQCKIEQFLRTKKYFQSQKKAHQIEAPTTLKHGVWFTMMHLYAADVKVPILSSP